MSDYNPDKVKILKTPIRLKPGAEQAVREFLIEQAAQEVFRRYKAERAAQQLESEAEA